MSKLICSLLLTFFSISTYSSSLEIMSYNVENLFDTFHDEHHSDFEYLPFGHPAKEEGCRQIENSYYRGKCFRNNWDMMQYNTKVNTIVEVIRREGRLLPDILALVEVESPKVIEHLADELGYEHFYITDGQDARGINVGILVNVNSEVTVVSYEEIILNTSRLKKATRNILEVTLKVGNDFLKLYINHWPSQNNPTSDRIFAAETVRKRVIENNKKGYHSVVLGDLNVKASESPNPIDNILINGESKMFDVETEFRNDPSISDNQKRSIPPSSYYYRRGNDWTHLDRILVSSSLFDGRGLDVELNTFDIFAHVEYSTPVRARDSRGRNFDTYKPLRFDYHGNGRSEGASDHFPVSMKISF
jgi:endonuclease/exonuclease/phosphatase family metal-dependent hydrolase